MPSAPLTLAELMRLARDEFSAMGLSPDLVDTEFVEQLYGRIVERNLSRASAERYARAALSGVSRYGAPLTEAAIVEYAKRRALKERPIAVDDDRFWRRILDAHGKTVKERMPTKKAWQYIKQSVHYAILTYRDPKEIPDDVLLRAFLKGFNSVTESPWTEVLRLKANEALVKVRARGPSGHDPLAYMRGAGHNYAKDLLLRAERAVRIEERIRTRNAAFAENLRKNVAAVRELQKLIVKAKKELPERYQARLRYIEAVYIDGKVDKDVAVLFPGTTEGQRYQWKSRMVTILWPKASPLLREYFSSNSPSSLRKER